MRFVKFFNNIGYNLGNEFETYLKNSEINNEILSSEIKEKICLDFCMDYVEGEVCEKCKIPGNDFCMVSRLITNKIKNRDESEE